MEHSIQRQIHLTWYSKWNSRHHGESCHPSSGIGNLGWPIFSIVCNEYTDISNKEQLTMCIWWVDQELEAHNDFFRFYNVPDIGVESVVSAIKDVLLKLQLSLVNCRRQCYDGASNMMGHKNGVAKRIQDLQPKAYPTHCDGHSLSFSSSQRVLSTSSLWLWWITPSSICIILHIISNNC